MNTLFLKRLTLVNFKGARNLSINFTKVTQINGDNGTGKTTVFDGYNWLLYGKDSKGDAQFDIKTLDSENNPIPKIEHTVEGVFDLNGKEIVFRREYREKWQNIRGTADERMTGHETKYFIDDVAVSKSAYEAKVSAILDQSVSRMISSPSYFNEEMDWKQRRAILSEMAGEILDEEILQKIVTVQNKHIYLINVLNQGKDLEDEKKRLAAARKKLKDELKLIPSRIEEVKRMIPETTPSFEAIENEITSIDAEIEKIDLQISDLNKSYQNQVAAINEKRKEKSDFEVEYQKRESENRLSVSDKSELIKQRSELNSKLSILKAALEGYKDKRSELLLSSETKANRLAGLREEYNRIKASDFNQANVETSCPTCKRELENAQQKIDELQENHNKYKAERLEENKAKGLGLKAEIESISYDFDMLSKSDEGCRNEIKEKQRHVDSLNDEINKPTPEPKPTKEMIDLKAKIDAFVIDETIKQPDTSELMFQRKELQDQKEAKRDELSAKETIQKNKQRVAELEKSKREMSEEVAEIEGRQFEIEHFVKNKIELVESRVNSMFSIVKFKMFKDQVNGGQEPTCECLKDGVPHKSVNQAGQVQAGLDIINTLQSHFKVSAPVFVDKKESVVYLPEYPFQVVYLKVDERAKKLQVLNLD